MIVLPENLEQRRREVERFLKGKNRWDSVPPHIKKAMMDNLNKITFISNSPDNIDGIIRSAQYIEYTNLDDMNKDIAQISEWGIVNLTPTREKIIVRNKEQWIFSRSGIRLWIMPKKEETYTIVCLEKRVNETDFMNSMMGGKL